MRAAVGGAVAIYRQLAARRADRTACTYNRRVSQPLQFGHRARLVRVLSAAVAVLSVLVTAWFLGAKSIVEKAVHSRTQPWAVFQVPETAVPLIGLEATLTGNVVTICNRSNDEW